MNYQPSPGRYAQMEYRRCGDSGLKLPAVSLGYGTTSGLLTTTKIAETLFLQPSTAA
jgi:L-glyceraldehyde 3-phosphate reductase